MISSSAIKCLRPRVKYTPVLVSYLPFVFVLPSLTLKFKEIELHSANL